MNRDLLEKHFSPDQIKQRQGDRGEVLDYLEGASVIQRLNEAFNAEWSFEIIEHLIQEKEVLVSGRLTANGITKTQYGNKKREESVGDDLKAAATDCIKKCATLFGIGLHLYFEEKTVAAPPPVPAPPAARSNGNGNGNGYRQPVSDPDFPGRARASTPPPPQNTDNEESNDGRRVTARQLAAIFGISKGNGWSNKETREVSKDAYGKLPDFLTKREASAFIDRLKGGRR